MKFFTNKVGMTKLINFSLKCSTILFVAFYALTVDGQITGSVFRDFDGDGIKTENEPYVSGVIVTAYGVDGQSCATATTSSQGNGSNYQLTGCGDQPVRIEFSITEGVCVDSGLDYSAYQGGVYGTSVQFVTGNTADVNFALHNPADYNQGALQTHVYVATYSNGDPLGGGDAGSSAWFYGFPYDNSGNSDADNPPTHVLSGETIGSVWGTAYSRQAGKIFTSALMKRHTGLGVMGSGGIYMLEPTDDSFEVTEFYDLDANGIRTRAASTAPAYGEGSSFEYIGTPSSTLNYLGAIDPLTGKPEGFGVVGSNVERGLAPERGMPNFDPAAFDQVGKLGLGALAISDDGRYLFVTNLYARTVVRLELNDVANPTSVVGVTTYQLPEVSCNNGELRPFGLRFFRDKLYVGAVCTGENDGENIVGGASDLYAYVFQLNTPTGSASFDSNTNISEVLNYRKGKARNEFDGNDQWYPWTNDSDALNATSAAVPPTRGSYAQPILSDLDFTERGDLILSFMDRGGHQWGHQNKRFLGGEERLVRYQIGGDVLIAGKDCSTGDFVLENGGVFTSSGQVFGSLGSGNVQGPGGGEFFYGEFHEELHEETHMGSVGVLYGQGKVMNTLMNPFNVFSGGTVMYSSNNADRSNEYQLYGSGNLQTGTFGKANGLGDIVFARELPSIEIGNYVWFDADNDGVQTSNEPGIDGIEVELYKDGVLVGQTTTSNGGQYYFNGSNVNLNGADGLVAHMDYEVRIAFDQTPIEEYNLTLSNVSPIAGEMPDHSDNDGLTGTGFAYIALTTGEYGANNHSYDFGFNDACPTPIVFSLSAEDATTCDGTDGLITISGLLPNTTYALTYTYNSTQVGPTNVQSTTSGTIVISNLQAGKYTDVTLATEFCSTTNVIGVEIEEPEVPVFELSSVDPTECEADNGSISILSLLSETEYSISYSFDGSLVPTFQITTDAEGTIILDGLAEGEYSSFTVSRFNCVGSSDEIIELLEPEAPEFTVSSAPLTACFPPNGTITLSGLDAETVFQVGYKYNGINTGPFNLTSNTAGEIVLTGIPEGLYTEIYVSKDACRTTDNGQILMELPDGPTFAIEYEHPTLCNEEDGSITLTELQPTTSYTISYTHNLNQVGPLNLTTNSSGNILISGLDNGIYSNFSVSLQGCENSTTQVILLEDPNKPEFDIVSENPTVCDDEDGEITLNGLESNTTYQVQWYFEGSLQGPFERETNAAGEIILTELSAGDYTNFMVSLDECEGTVATTITLEAPEGPVFDMTFDNPTNCLDSDGSIELNGLEANTIYVVSYTYNALPTTPVTISSDASGLITFSNLEPGNYTDVAVSLNGCQTISNQAMLLEEPEGPEIEAGGAMVICEGTAITLIAYNPDNANIQWDNGVEDGVPFTPLVGNYVYTLSAELNGCESQDQVAIQVDPEILTLSCRDFEYQLGRRECGVVTDFQINILDGCQPGGADQAILEHVSGLEDGQYVEAGTYTSSWRIVDSEGNILDECTFEIVVHPYEGGSTNLVCNDLVNISIGEGCIADINADMILEGDNYNCYSEYIVTISYPQIPGINVYPNGDYSGANRLDYTHVGLTLVVVVTDPVTGNSCWGKIKVEDKFPPVLVCEELEFPCTSDYDKTLNPLLINFPSELVWPRDFITTRGQNPFIVRPGLIDCSEVELTFTDVSYTLDCTDEGIWRKVLRTWVAKDQFGNTSSCVQEINFSRLTIDEVLTITGLEEGAMIPVACDEEIPELNFQGACNIWIGIKSDVKLPLCNNSEHSYKLFRNYTIFDDCTGEKVEIEVVYVKMDTEGPSFPDAVNGELLDREYVSNVYSCMAEIVLVPPVVVDNCSEEIRLVPSIPNVQIINNGNHFIAWLGIQQEHYTVEWTASDDCDNISTVIERIIIQDTKPPVAVCVHYTKVALTANLDVNGNYTDGIARVFASSFDNGSYDNCEIYDLKVMRMSQTTRTYCGQTHNTNENPRLGSTPNPFNPNAPHWRDYVDFCCEDIAAGEPVMVVLRVRDIYGNINYCMVQVEVETKVPPVINAPDNVTLDCRDVNDVDGLSTILQDKDLSIQHGFGWADVSSICDEEVRVSVNVNLNECGVTTSSSRILRTFSVGTGANVRTDVQEIFVVNQTPFYISSNPIHSPTDDVVWPQDITLASCDDLADLKTLVEQYGETNSVFADFSDLPTSLRPKARPYLRYVSCSLPGLGHDDWTFELEGGCKKIIRRWKVIDWCQYDDNGNNLIWMYDQTIKIMDSNPAEFVDFTVRLVADGAVTENLVSGCTNEVIEVAHMSASCAPALSLLLNVDDDCSELQKLYITHRIALGTNNSSFVPSDVELSGNGHATAEGGYDINYGIVAYSKQNIVHRIYWTIDDRCGNISECHYDFIIKDAKKPSPICTDHIVSVIMPSGGMIDVTASWYDIASFDNCPAESLRYTFDAPYGTTGAKETKTFTCEDYAQNYSTTSGTSIITLPIYVTDGAGNFDFCMVRLELQDNDGVCGAPQVFELSGHVKTHLGSYLDGFGIINVNGKNNNVSDIGHFHLSLPDTFQNSFPLMIKGDKMDPVTNGVTTYDIDQITSHMLGSSILTNPYERIAADVNSDGRINMLDVLELRQLVLLKRDHFSGANHGLSWKFINAEYVFVTNTPESEPYLDYTMIEEMNDKDKNNFIAIKIGDVNSTVVSNNGIDGRNNNVSSINVADSEIKKGEVTTIWFSVEESYRGYQMALDFNPSVEIISVESDIKGFTQENYNVLKNSNMLLLSWNGVQNTSPMFRVQIRSHADGKVSDIVSISKQPLHPVAEMYSNDDIYSLNLRFVQSGDVEIAEREVVNQNEPNPFNSTTRVSFTLVDQNNVNFVIRDLSGKIIMEFNGDYPSGKNEITISGKDLPSSGVYYLTVIVGTNGFTHVQKIVHIK